MYLNNDKLTQFLVKYQIDIYQFWILYLRAAGDYKNLEVYCKEFGLFDRELHKIKDLEKRGLIEPLGNAINGEGKIEFLDLIPLGELARITDWIFIDCDIAGQELYEVYPKMINIQGKMIVSTKGETLGGIYYDKDKLLSIYGKKINNNKALHKRILETITLAKEQNLINFTFRSFIFDELWNNLFEMVETEHKSYSKTKSV